MATARGLPKTQKAAQIHEQGEIDVIQVREVEVKQPAAGEVLIKVEFAGVNFIDTYFRGGVYKPALPYVLGNESAGTVVAVGSGVTSSSHGFSVGDKVVAYTAGGSFAEYALAKADKVVKLPDGFSTREAATAITQGLTALTFVKEAHEVKKGQFVLVQAAAGGLGLLLVQLAKHYGATVIGTTSTEEKAEIARKAGADHVLLYGSQNWEEIVQQVYDITGGEGIDRGVHAVFDGVGKDTFDVDFELLRRKGTLVTLGNASGAVPPFAPLKLGPKNLKGESQILFAFLTRPSFVRDKGAHCQAGLLTPSLPSLRHSIEPPSHSCLSLSILAVLFNPDLHRTLRITVCRPVLNQYVHTREEFQTYATELFSLVQQGELKLAVHGEYNLTTEGVRQTQRDITSRKTSGKLLVKVADA